MFDFSLFYRVKAARNIEPITVSVCFEFSVVVINLVFWAVALEALKIQEDYAIRPKEHLCPHAKTLHLFAYYFSSKHVCSSAKMSKCNSRRQIMNDTKRLSTSAEW